VKGVIRSSCPALMPFKDFILFDSIGAFLFLRPRRIVSGTNPETILDALRAHLSTATGGI